MKSYTTITMPGAKRKKYKAAPVKAKQVSKDSKYVSRQDHEITTICNRFRSEGGEPANAPLIYHILTEMACLSKSKKVLRSDMESVLLLMGYQQK